MKQLIFIPIIIVLTYMTGLAQLNHLDWYFTVGSAPGTGSLAYSSKLHLLENDEIEVTGYYYHKVDFDPSADSTILPPGLSGSSSSYLAKYSQQGEFENIVHLPALRWLHIYESVLDADGNLYTCGTFSAADFDPSIGEFSPYLPNSNDFGLYVAKYNENRELLWVQGSKEMKDVNALNAIRMNIHLDEDNGFVYVSANIYEDLVVDSASSASISLDGDEDAILMQYDTSGQFNWVKKMGSTIKWSTNLISDIETDDVGNVYISASYSDSTFIEPSTPVVLYAPGRRTGHVIVKYSSSGNYLWHQALTTDNYLAIPQKNTQIVSSSMELELDDNNNLYIAGLFFGTLQFGPNTTDTLIGSPAANVIPFAETIGHIYLIKYSSTGIPSWSKKMRVSTFGGGSLCGIQRLKIYHNNLWLSGFSDDEVFLDNQTIPTHTGEQMIFLSRYAFNGDYISSDHWERTSTLGSGQIRDFRFTSTNDLVVLTAYRGDFNITPDTTATTITSVYHASDNYFLISKWKNLGVSDEVVLAENNNIGLFPNPAKNGNFVIQWGDVNVKAVRIIRATGHVVFDELIADNTQRKGINLNTPAGVYFILVQTEKGTIHKKIVVE